MYIAEFDCDIYNPHKEKIVCIVFINGNEVCERDRECTITYTETNVNL